MFKQNDYSLTAAHRRPRVVRLIRLIKHRGSLSTEIFRWGRTFTHVELSDETDPDGAGNVAEILFVTQADAGGLTIGYTVRADETAGDVATAFPYLIMNVCFVLRAHGMRNTQLISWYLR